MLAGAHSPGILMSSARLPLSDSPEHNCGNSHCKFGGTDICSRGKPDAQCRVGAAVKAAGCKRVLQIVVVTQKAVQATPPGRMATLRYASHGPFATLAAAVTVAFHRSSVPPFQDKPSPDAHSPTAASNFILHHQSPTPQTARPLFVGGKGDSCYTMSPSHHLHHIKNGRVTGPCSNT